MRRQLSSAEALNDAPQDEYEIEITPAHLRRLARIRRNLEALRVEISEKILAGAQECRETCNTTLELVGELHATVTESTE